MRRLITIFSAIFLIHPLAISIANSAGDTAATFLEVTPGARPMSMGGAFTSITNDINGIPSNPAGIGFLKTKAVTFTYASYFENLSYGYSAYAYPFKRGGTLGLSATLLDSGDINRTEEDSLGNFSNQNGQFQTRDMALALSYGVSVNPNLGFGLTARHINQKVDNASISGWSADSGAIWKSPVSGLNLGVAATNMGPSFNEHKLPTSLAAGISYTPMKQLTMTSDVVKPLDNETSYRGGIEISPLDFFALRGGYKNDSDIGSHFYAGMGFQLALATFDYAFAQSNEFSNTHRISLTLKFQ